MSFKQVVLRSSIAVSLLLIIVLAVILPLIFTGAFNSINSTADLKEFILKGGATSIFIFCILQFLQVTFLPIPAMVTTVAGTMIFGPWITLVTSFISIMAGSLFAFFLGRKLGTNIVFWVAGYRKGSVLINKISKGKYAFFLMMLFPFFPDDVLCMVAGVTNMSYGFFILTNLISRPIGLIPMCFLGTGDIIPFSGWGIPVWIVLIVLVGIAFIISVKYQPQIEQFFNKLIKHKNDNNMEEKKCLLKNKHFVINRVSSRLSDQ